MLSLSQMTEMMTLDDTLALLQDLIRIPSLSREEAACADSLEQYLQARGQTVNRCGNNLWCQAPGYDSSRPTLLLNSHIDTVTPASSWKRQPFEPSVEDGRLYGLGSNDAGASVCCLVQTFLHLSQKPQSYNLVLGLSCEEEITGTGGIERLMQARPPIDLAIVGEPTGMRAAVAEKGLMVLDCTAHGQAGHAAHNTGDNAIYKAMKDIAWFQHTRLPRVSDLLGPVKMTVTVIQAGTRHNIIPDTCTFTVDVRVNELYRNEELCEYIKTQVDCEVKARSYRLSSSGIDLGHPVVERCRQLGLECYGSPTLSDQARMSCPSLKIGPGDSLRSHTADEYICLDELSRGLQLYASLLDGLKLK